MDLLTVVANRVGLADGDCRDLSCPCPILRARELDGGVIEPDEATVLAARVIA